MTKNTLWIFGDSFSWDHKLRFKHWPMPEGPSSETDTIFKYIQEYLGGEVFESWGEQLANSLNLNYINHASFQSEIKSFKNKELGTGPSANNQINLVHELSDKFKKGDIVIFGFTSSLRFDYCCEDWSCADTILPNSPNTDKYPLLQELVINRSEHKYYRLNEYQKLKGIETLSDVVGFQLWYWDFPSDYTELVLKEKIPNDRWIYYKINHKLPSFTDNINNKQIGNISWETNDVITDGHYGKQGNDVKADILINFFKKQKL